MMFRATSRSWTPAERADWSLAKLRQVVRQAAADTSFYRQRFLEADFDPLADFSFDDFARLPVLERGDVADHAAEMLSPRVALDQRQKDATVGSSGVPLTYWSGPEERGWRLSVFYTDKNCFRALKSVVVSYDQIKLRESRTGGHGSPQ